MPDNANPIIHGRADAATSKRRTAFLDDSDEEDWFSLGDVSDVVSSASGSSRGSGTAGRPNGHQGRVTGDEEPIDAEEIFDLIRSVTDPEHPLTLEQLAVVSKEQITVTHASDSTTENPHVLLEFTPTIPHCSMATLIGLTLRVRLLRALPDRFKVDIKVKEGTHQSERSVNKQLNDKERVAAALENEHLLNVVQQCLSTAGQRGKVPTTA